MRWFLPGGNGLGWLQDIDPEFSVDLVDLDDCPDSLVARVEAEGLLI